MVAVPNIPQYLLKKQRCLTLLFRQLLKSKKVVVSSVMDIDTYYFFLIILGGFMTVWSFRHFSLSRKPLGDFEYLGFSSFWGMIMLMILVQLNSGNPDLSEFLSNPFAVGSMLSVIGFIIGGILGYIKKVFTPR